jgi:hypothetical protein
MTIYSERPKTIVDGSNSITITRNPFGILVTPGKPLSSEVDIIITGFYIISLGRSFRSKWNTTKITLKFIWRGTLG